MTGPDAPLAQELPILLLARRRFDPSRMGALDRREYEQEIRVAATRQVSLRAECLARHPEWLS